MTRFQKEHYEGEMQKAEEDQDIAKQEWKRIKHDLEQHEIKAEIPGQVVWMYKKKGEAVKALEPVMHIANPDKLRIEGLVDIQNAGFLRPGMRAIVEPSIVQAPTRQLSGHTGAVTGLAVTPDSRFLASASEDGMVIIWNWSTGAQVKQTAAQG